MRKERAFHIASVDDYDDNDSEEPVETLVFPFLAYDPGLLDTAVILISTSRTQSIHVVNIDTFKVDYHSYTSAAPFSV